MINFVQTRHETKDALAIYKRYRSELRVGVISIFGWFIVKTYPCFVRVCAKKGKKELASWISTPNSKPEVLNIEIVQTNKL